MDDNQACSRQLSLMGLALLTSLLLLTGCASHSGQDFSTASAAQIRSGVTDKATVERNLGQPFNRYIGPNGDETWMYLYSETRRSVGATAFIPFVGPMLPGSSKSDSDAKRVTIVFHGDIVASCSLVIASDSANGAMMAGGGDATRAYGRANTTTQSTNCGDGPGK